MHKMTNHNKQRLKYIFQIHKNTRPIRHMAKCFFFLKPYINVYERFERAKETERRFVYEFNLTLRCNLLLHYALK